MDKLKWGIGVVLMTIAMYLLTYFFLCKASYRGLPLVYLFSDYLGPNGGFTYNKSLEWNAALHEQKKWDVIVLGASRAERSYNPDFFSKQGIQLFNWGTSAQSIQNSAILLTSILDRAAPKEVWLDIVPASFKPEALESTADLIQNVSSHALAMHLAQSSGDIRSVNLLAKRFFCSNETWEKKGKSEYQGNGFVSVSDVMERDVYQSCLKGPFAERAYIEPSQEAWKALDVIIALCQSKAVKLRIIVSPTTPLYNRHDHDWLMQQLMERLKESAFELYDFSEDEHFKIPNHFYDEKHLNHAGAMLFDSLFLSAIDFK